MRRHQRSRHSTQGTTVAQVRGRFRRRRHHHGPNHNSRPTHPTFRRDGNLNTPANTNTRNRYNVHRRRRVRHNRRPCPRPFTNGTYNSSHRVTPNTGQTDHRYTRRQRRRHHTDTTGPTTRRRNTRRSRYACHRPLQPMQRIQRQTNRRTFILAVNVMRAPVATSNAFTNTFP